MLNLNKITTQINSKHFNIVIIKLLILLIGLQWLNVHRETYLSLKEQQNNPKQNIVRAVNQKIRLPLTEQPIIIQANNDRQIDLIFAYLPTLKQIEITKKDYLLIFPKWQRIIVYRQSLDQIVDVNFLKLE